jgi:SAM-dependent methyltransferase
VRWLAGSEPARVLDLGAGTGKLTRALVALGHDVIAVEPSPEMIEELRRALPGVEALEGAAERIPVPDGRFDVVTAGQAFHWFDRESALPEIARVLRPGGTLGLVWNAWNVESPVVARLYGLLPPFGTGGDPNAPVFRSDLFGPIEEAAFEWVRAYGRDELVETVSTQSSVATLGPADRADRLAAVGRLWDEEAADGVLELPFRTETHRAVRL